MKPRQPDRDEEHGSVRRTRVQINLTNQPGRYVWRVDLEVSPGDWRVVRRDFASREEAEAWRMSLDDRKNLQL